MMPAKMGLGAAAAAVLLFTGCVQINAPEHVRQHESKSVDPGGAQAVSVEVHLGAGELQMRGGSQTLMDASFRYGSPAWKPEVKYNVVGTHGRLIIRQGSGGISGHDGSEWDLRLNNDIPMDVEVHMGAGASRLDLGNMQVRNVDVQMGAGELKLDLTGHPKHDIDVRVRGGVGEATLRLPRSAAVEVEAHGGIGGINARGLEKRDGKYVNEAAGTDGARVRVNVHGGVGGINLICE